MPIAIRPGAGLVCDRLVNRLTPDRYEPYDLEELGGSTVGISNRR